MFGDGQVSGTLDSEPETLHSWEGKGIVYGRNVFQLQRNACLHHAHTRKS